MFGVELQIMQMELVASPCAQVSAVTPDLMYVYSIYSLSSCIHYNVDRCTVRIIINPRRMRRRVTVVVLCVCLSVCYHASCYMPRL